MPFFFFLESKQEFVRSSVANGHNMEELSMYGSLDLGLV